VGWALPRPLPYCRFLTDDSNFRLMLAVTVKPSNNCMCLKGKRLK